MVGTASHPGPYDPLENARADEPIFTLVARDPDAPGCITFWAQCRRNRAVKRFGDSKRKRDSQAMEAEFRQCAEAEEVAMAMVEWSKGEGEHEGDGRASYADVQKSAEQVAEARTAKRKADLIRNLREAAYHLCEARDGLLDIGLIDEDHGALFTGAMQLVNGTAESVETKRERFNDEPALPLSGEAV